MSTCSFSESAGGRHIKCGTNTKVASALTVPVSDCTKSISTHLSNNHINLDTVESEAMLLMLRGGFFSSNVRVFSSLTICPNHRHKLGVGWSCGKMCSLCFVNKRMPKGTLTREQSSFLFSTKNRFIGIGSGVCVKCRTTLIKELQEFQPQPQQWEEHGHDKVQNDDDGDDSVNDNIYEESASRSITFAEELLQKQKGRNEVGSPTLDSNFSQSTVDLSQGSEWLPSASSSYSQDSENMLIDKREALDFFLGKCGVSPIKKTLTTVWYESSSRTQADYLRKSKQILAEVLKVMTPGQEKEVYSALFENKEKESSVDMLEVICMAYKEASDWGTQRQILSLIAADFSLREINKHLPDLSKYKYIMARKHKCSIGPGQPHIKSSEIREHLSDLQINHFLDFIMSPAVMTDAPFGENRLKLSSGQTIDVPKIILNSVRSRVVEQYKSYCIETEFPLSVSQSSYMRILQAVGPSVRKCMKGLDNYAADGAKAFEDVKKAVLMLGRLGMGSEWAEEKQTELVAAKQYLKMEYKMHVSNQSEVADHCCQYALSTGSGEFSVSCDHRHQQSCENCERLIIALDSIEDAFKSEETVFESDDQKDEIQYNLIQGRKAIEEWKKHILRSVNQDLARSDTLSHLKEDEVYIERDWAMKFLPMVYRESQSKWFAKRGINWHVSVGSFLVNGELTSQTIVHLFDNATQDALTSNAILLDTLRRLNQINPKLMRSFLRSDNAGCFHSYTSIFGIKAINEKSPIKVERVDFADPQGGKSICDRRASHLKNTVRKFVNEGNDVRTASEFLKAIENSKTTNTTIVVALPPPSTIQGVKVVKKCPLKNITSLYNFEMQNEGIKVWKQYRIGKGQELPYNLCLNDNEAHVPEIKVLESITTPTRNKPVAEISDLPLNGNTNEDLLAPFESTTDITAPLESSSDTNAPANYLENEMNGLFSCPEPNCRSTFSKYGNLVHHLDVGKHNISKVSMSLSDRSKLNYANKMEQKNVARPQVATNTSKVTSTNLNKGWALKNKREIKRFSEKQKNFLQHKFDIGEKSGMKCDPEDVSIEMRSVRNNGERIFSMNEFLTASQIASYFSRLCLLKRKRSTETLYEEDFIAAEYENHFQEMNLLAKQ